MAYQSLEAEEGELEEEPSMRSKEPLDRIHWYSKQPWELNDSIEDSSFDVSIRLSVEMVEKHMAIKEHVGDPNVLGVKHELGPISHSILCSVEVVVTNGCLRSPGYHEEEHNK